MTLVALREHSLFFAVVATVARDYAPGSTVRHAPSALTQHSRVMSRRRVGEEVGAVHRGSWACRHAPSIAHALFFELVVHRHEPLRRQRRGRSLRAWPSNTKHVRKVKQNQHDFSGRTRCSASKLIIEPKHRDNKTFLLENSRLFPPSLLP